MYSGISAAMKAKYTDQKSHTVNYHVAFYDVMEMDSNEPIITIGNSQIAWGGFELTTATTDGYDLSIGNISTARLVMTAAEISRQLKGKYMKVWQTLDDETEELPIGRFIVSEVKQTGEAQTFELTAYDYTCLFDDGGSEVMEEIKGSKTVKQALAAIADHYGLDVDWASFGGAESRTIAFDYDAHKEEDVTARDLVGMLATFLGGWIRANREGKLEFYSIGAVDTDSCENVGYNMSQASYEPEISAKVDNVTYTDLSNNSYKATSGKVAVDVTGNYFIGKTKSEIEGNLAYILSKIKDIQFYPAQITTPARPYMDAGDYIAFTIGGKTIHTICKGMTMSGVQGQMTEIRCLVEETDGVGYISNQNKQNASVSYVQRINYTLLQAQQELANAIANSSGMYSTDELQPDGSTIHYLHDKPTLAESTNIIKTTSEAIAFSTDGGVTYPYGLMINGAVIASYLSAIGVNADWINAGAMSIGGMSGNTDGCIAVYDAKGNLICKIDKTGFSAIMGAIAGWTIETSAIRSGNGTIELNSTENSIKFFSATSTLLMKITNAGIYNYDTSGKLRNTLSMTSSTYYDANGTRRIVVDADGFNQYGADGTYLGHLGRSTVYKVDGSGNATSEELGEILSVNVEDADEALGWAVFAVVPGSTITSKQRRVYYCAADNLDYERDHFYVNCETTMLRHTETDPYYTKKIVFNDAAKSFSVTVGATASGVSDITNNFTYTEDSAGRVTSITNAVTGKTLVVEYQ